MALDLEKLILIMRRTESDNDNEAVVALRMANRMLAAAGKHWGDVLNLPLPRSTFSIEMGPRKRGKGDTSRYGRRASQRAPDDGQKHTDPTIAVWLKEVSERRHDVSTLMLLAGIRDDWERKKYLTTPQLDTIKRMFAAQPKGGPTWKF